MTDKELLKHAITRIAKLTAKVDQLTTVIGKYQERIENLEVHVDHLLEELELQDVKNVN